MKGTNNYFGWAIHRYTDGPISGDAPRSTVFTFTFREDAEAFKAAHSLLRNSAIHASYEMSVPAYGTPGIIYEVHTRAGGGCGTEPAGLGQWPHRS